MGGLGKTTLVKKVFEDGQVKRHFQSHAWITVSQSFDIVVLLKRMIKELAVPPIKEPVGVDQLKESIKQFLQGKRYVIVLDDVWTINAWDDIKYVLSNNNCGSRVLLTTRLLDVARASTFESHGHVHEIKPLSDEDSWTLFCKKTFEDQSRPRHLEEISRNIIRKCEGLPLAIVAIGGMLALKDKSIIDEWEMVLRNLTVAHKGGYFNELLNRSLIQVVRTTIEGRPKACQIHDLLREIILSKSREQNIITLASELDVIWPEKIRRLVIHGHVQAGQESKCFHRLRTMLVLGGGFAPSLSSVSILALLRRGPKLLKVLDLTNVRLGTFPDEVCELVHLRFLSMRNTWVDVIPKSIGKLWNLETLDLTDTSVVELPVEIGKLRKLRHLVDRIEYLGVGFKTLAEIGNLSSLQKLLGIEANHSIVEKVGNLTQLRSLGITNLRRGDGRALRLSLEKLINLRSLFVQSGQSDEIIDLTSLTLSLPFLQKLQLGGRLEKLPHWIPSLHSLLKVRLWDSGLMDSQLQCLQDLPNLLELGLTDAYYGETLCFIAGKFRRLKRLLLSSMEKLTRATVEHGAMPNLVERSIESCDNLKELPSGIEHLTNLQSLYVSGRTSSWIHTLEKNQHKESDDWRKIAHIPEVELVTW
ncbi:unnamed protein product [Ilex paraguariensis]|uniref:NB-ARC domain-containing protein n=1 Tax=Ilex paraguariensis TaxID=185542 RepID=A0ABC8TDU8_9AQUA